MRLKQQRVGAAAELAVRAQPPAEMATLRFRDVLLMQPSDQCPEVDFDGIDLHHRGIELGNVEQCVELGAEGERGSSQMPGDAARRGVERLQPERLGEQRERMHRLAQDPLGRQ